MKVSEKLLRQKMLKKMTTMTTMTMVSTMLWRSQHVVMVYRLVLPLSRGCPPLLQPRLWDEVMILKTATRATSTSTSTVSRGS